MTNTCFVLYYTDITPSGMETVTFELLDTDSSFCEFCQLLQNYVRKSARNSEYGETVPTQSTHHPVNASNNKHERTVDGNTACNDAATDLTLHSAATCYQIRTPSCSSSKDKEVGCSADQKCMKQCCASRQETGGVCMIGLHCCGSLTPTMLKVMTKMEDIQALVCVGCCYHSMQITGKYCHHILGDAQT